jgi:hypothetical protein
MFDPAAEILTLSLPKGNDLPIQGGSARKPASSLVADQRLLPVVLRSRFPCLHKCPSVTC